MKSSYLFIFYCSIVVVLLSSCKSSMEEAVTNCSQNIDLEEVIKEYQNKGKALATIDFSQTLDPKWTQTDFQLFRRILEEANPNIYRYATKEKIDSLFDAKLCVLRDSTSYLGFIRSIAQLYNAVACGHSSWMHSPAYRNYRDTVMKFFPLRLFLENDRYYVKQNASIDTSIKVGDELLSINNSSPKAINELLRLYMYRDGESAPKAKREIAEYFEIAYSNFIANPDVFQLELINTQGQRYFKTLTAQPKQHIDSILNRRYAKKESMGVPLRLKIDSLRNMGIYTIKWFRNEYIQQYGQDFNAFTDSVFQLLSEKGIENLIIDIRGNKGGWTANGRKLFSYFINEPMDYIQKVELNQVDTFSFEPLILVSQGLNDTMNFKQQDNALYEWINYPSLKVEPAKENRFDGKVFILIDDMSRSCSAIFASLMRAHTDAVFVGEENGGAQCGQGGMVILVKLPYTGVVVTTSTAKYTTNINELNGHKGVQVDYSVPVSWDDHINHRDPQLELVYTLVNK